MMRCKVCKMEYATEQGYEMHRLAHILKDIDGKIDTMNKYFEKSVNATIEALKAST